VYFGNFWPLLQNRNSDFEIKKVKKLCKGMSLNTIQKYIGSEIMILFDAGINS